MSNRINDFFNAPDGAFEDMLNRTREAAEAIGKKSAERIELSRKKVEYIDIKAKLNKLYEKYGRLHYSIYIGDVIDDEELVRIADEIAAHKEKLELLANDIDAAKAKFNEAVSSAAQMAYDVIRKEKAPASEVEVDAAEFFEEEE